MTYGHWLGEARTHIAAATQQLRSAEPPVMSEQVELAAARNAVYRGLVRHVDLLLGTPSGAAGHIAIDQADIALARREDHLNRFAIGLRAASDGTAPPASSAPCIGPARTLRAAGEAISIAGDILASHVRTPWGGHTIEGASIRAGGGVAGGLVEVAALAKLAISLDRRMVAWLSGRAAPPATLKSFVQAARWTSQSRLADVAHAIVRAGRYQPPLLHGLRVAPGPPRESDLAVSPAYALASVRTWLRRNPRQVQVGQIHAATQLGLAVCLSAGEPGPELGLWRRAAVAAGNLYGVVALAGEPQEAERVLSSLANWIRQELSQGLRPFHAEPEQHGLLDQLPLLAEGVAAGVTSAVARRDIFVNEMELRRPSGALIHYATTVWGPARASDTRVRSLAEALQELSPPKAANAFEGGLRRASSLAFPSSPSVEYGAGIDARHIDAAPIVDRGLRHR